MNRTIILNIARQYLKVKNIDFVEPGELGRLEGSKQEVIFLDPQIFDPNVAIVEPGDIRIWVDINTKEASLVEQM